MQCRHIGRAFLLSVLLFFTLNSNPCIADNQLNTLKDTQKKLQSVKKQTTSLAGNLRKKNKQKADIQAELKGSEKKISKLSKTVLLLKTELHKSLKRIDRLNSEIQTLNKKTAQIKINLKTAIRNAYRDGAHSNFKLLLNLTEPHQVSRALYHQRLIQDLRLKRLLEAKEASTQLYKHKKQLTEEQNRLHKQQTSLNEKESAIKRQYAKRQAALSVLEKNINKDNERLLQNKKQRQALSALVAKLSKEYKDAQRAGNTTSLKAQKGKLKWPASGKIIHHFNDKRARTQQLRWKGSIIASNLGQPVYAIHQGQVVYSDWMTGFGNLIIIDHGGGYMSLYGFNQAILKEAGDKIKGGEQIATVGNSGGNINNALYFEIRYKNKAMNPAHWCLPRR